MARVRKPAAKKVEKKPEEKKATSKKAFVPSGVSQVTQNLKVDPNDPRTRSDR